MKNNPLSKGDEPSLAQVLDTRERRVQFQEQLAKKHEGKSLIAFKLNIPGPIKNNPLIKSVFETGLKKIYNELERHHSPAVYQKIIDEITGPEAFIITDGDVREIKKLMINVEEKSATGRLYDLDVMKAQNNEFIYITRDDLSLAQRRCLICDKPAKVCGRSRAHSVEQMLDHIYKLIEEDNIEHENKRKDEKDKEI